MKKETLDKGIEILQRISALEKELKVFPPFREEDNGTFYSMDIRLVYKSSWKEINHPEFAPSVESIVNLYRSTIQSEIDKLKLELESL